MKKIRKKFINRTISALLAGAMTAGVIPASVFAEEEPQRLETAMPDAGEIQEGMSVFGLGTQQAEVEEHGKYILTVFRQGDLSNEQTVVLYSTDVSAKYGEDYRIIADNTEETPMENTIFESYADEDKAKESEENVDYVQSVIDSSTSEDTDQTIEEYLDENSEDETKEPDAAEEGSTLAKMKEEQTGVKSRTLTDTPLASLQSQILPNMSVENGYETSSETSIKFAPGEESREIVFEIIDDKKSEGDEIFQLILETSDENTSVIDPSQCGIVIKDDEPIEHSKLSFTQNEYTSDGEKATVTVKREGAEYSFVTAKVNVKENGDAQDGIDFAGGSVDITFIPYVNEQSVDIPVSGNSGKTFSVELSDVTGGENGETINSAVKIGKNRLEKTNSFDNFENEEIAELSGSNTLEFNLGSQGKVKSYEVEYNNGDRTAPIIDDNGIEVGEYIFPSDFDYGYYFGDSATTRLSHTQKISGWPFDVAHLYWYNWRTWKVGSSACTVKVNHTKYQYYSPNWEQSRYVFGGQKVKMRVLTSDWSELSSKTVKGSFDHSSKSNSKGYEYHRLEQGLKTTKTVDKNVKPASGEGSIEIYAYDDESNMTPKTELYVYGIAAMYRKFNVEVAQPEEMEFKNADGSVRREIPASVTLPQWQKTRYTNQTIAPDIRALSGEKIKGTIKGWKIYIGDKSFVYETKNQTLTLDTDLIEKIDEYTDKVVTDDWGYYTDIKVQPVFEYKPVKVTVLESSEGAFKSDDLKVGIHTMHLGDKICLEGTANDSNYYNSGYSMIENINVGDTKHNIDGEFKSNMDSFTLNQSEYIIKPLFTKGKNCIEVVYGDDWAKNNIEIIGKVPDSELPEVLKGKNILYYEGDDSGKVKEQYRLEIGKAYMVEVRVKGDDTSRRPVFEVPNHGNITAASVDLIADTAIANNRIVVKSEEYNPNDISCIQITGKAVYAANSIRDSAAAADVLPAIGANVYAGGDTATGLNDKKEKVYYTKHCTSVTNENGMYTINGIHAKSGDRISVRYENNDVQQVEYVDINTDNLNKESVTYEDEIYNEQDNTVEKKQITVDAYKINTEPVYMPIRTAYAPYITSVTYKYTDSTINDKVGTSANEVPIMADAEIEFGLSAELNGHKLKRAEFSLYSSKGSLLTTKKAEKANPDGTYTAKVDTSELQGGAKLYVRLVDAEPQRIGISQIDPVTGEEKIVYQEFEKEYTRIYSGITFYEPNIEVKPKEMSFSMADMGMKVPYIGDVAPTVSNSNVKLKVTKISSKIEGGKPLYMYTFGFSASTQDMEKKIQSVQKAMGSGSAAKEAQKSIDEKMNEYDTRGADAAKEEMQKVLTAQQLTDKKYEEIANDKEAYNDWLKEQTYANMGEYKWDLRVTFLLTFGYAYSESENTYKLFNSQFAMCGTFKAQKTWYWIVCGYPVYINITGEILLQVSGSYDENLKTDKAVFDNATDLSALVAQQTTFNTALGLKFMPGVGLCGVFGVRGIIVMDIAGVASSNSKNTGALISLSGGMGVDLVFLSFEVKIVTGLLGFGAYKNATGIKLLSEEDDISIKPIERGNMTNSVFGNGSGETDAELNSLKPKMIKTRTLADDVMAKIDPAIITLNGGTNNGKSFMAFLADDKDANDLNSSRVVCSMKNAYGEWEALEYADCEGMASSDITLIQSETDPDIVYIIWLSTDKVYPDDYNIEDPENAKEYILNTNYYMQPYNTAVHTFGDKIKITDDNYENGAKYQNMALKAELEGNLIRFLYMKRDLNKAETAEDLINISKTYTCLAEKEYDLANNEWVKKEIGGKQYEERLINIEHPTITDPAVDDYTTVNFGFRDNDDNNHDCELTAYIINESGDQNINSRKSLWLAVKDNTNGIEYKPIKIRGTGDLKSVNLFNAKDELYLSWVDGSTLNTINLSDVHDTILYEEAMIENRNVYENIDPTDFNWYINAAEGTDETSIFRMIANSEVIGNSINVVDDGSDNEKQVDISNYQIVKGKDDNIYMFWTAPGSTDPKDYSVELFASAFYTPPEIAADGKTDEEIAAAIDENIKHQSGWGQPVQVTDYGKVIDEVNVEVNELSHIEIVANCYEQKPTHNGMEYGPHSLVEIECVPSTSMEFKDGTFKLDDTYPIAGQKTNINYTMVNNGLLPSENIEVHLYAAYNGKQDLIAVKKYDKRVFMGEEISDSVEWTVPEYLNDADDLSIYVKVYEDGNTYEYIANLPVEKKADLEFGTPEIGGEFCLLTNTFDVDITNKGNVASEPMTITVTEGGADSDKNVAAVEKVDAIQPGETRHISAPLDFKVSEVGDLGILKFNAKAVYDNSGETADNNMTATLYTEGRKVIDVNDKISLRKGETYKLEPKIWPTPAKENSKLYYLSLDPEICSVDGNGVITARSTGSSWIFIYSDDGNTALEIVDVSVTNGGHGGSGSSGNTTKLVKFETNGGSEIASKRIAVGTVISELPTPVKDGYKFAGWYLDKDLINAIGNDTKVTDNITLYAKWEKDNKEDNITPTAKPESWKNPFSDISEKDWFFNAVKYTNENNLMQGIEDNKFGPEEKLTRGMLVTVLWRMEGEPKTDYKASFKDIDNSYYTDAVRWAAENNVVLGITEDSFEPNISITREQMAAIIYRYAKYKGYDINVGTNAGYKDTDDISEYAANAVDWAAEKGIMTGDTEGKFEPKTSTTRAQTAAVLMRISENFR